MGGIIAALASAIIGGLASHYTSKNQSEEATKQAEEQAKQARIAQRSPMPMAMQAPEAAPVKTQVGLSQGGGPGLGRPQQSNLQSAFDIASRRYLSGTPGMGRMV